MGGAVSAITSALPYVGAAVEIGKDLIIPLVKTIGGMGGS